MGILDDAAALAGFGPAKKVSPAAFDPARPNRRGYDVRMLLRHVHRQTGQVLAEHVLALHPSQYQRQPEARLTVHQTMGGLRADIPAFDARGPVHYTIQGTTGVWPEGRANGKPDGMAAIYTLQRMLADYMLPTVAGHPRADVRLELINPDEPITQDNPAGESAYEVVPSRSLVAITRSEQRPQTWAYVIRLSAIAHLKGNARERQRAKKKARSALDRVLGAVGALNAVSFDRLFMRYQMAMRPALRAKAAVESFRRFVEGWARGVDTFLAYNVTLWEDLISDLEAIGDIFDELGVPGSGRFDDDADDRRVAEQGARDARRAYHAALSTPGVLAPTLPRPAGRLGPRRGRPAIESPAQASNTRFRLSPADQLDGRDRAASGSRDLSTRLVSVSYGDTFDRFIPAGFTDLDVLEFNPDLIWPYVDGCRERPAGELVTPGGERVVYVGEVLRVPVLAGGGGGGVRAASPGAAEAALGPEAEDVRLFGRDIYLDPEARAWQIDPGKGDLRMIEGTDNLVQRLRAGFLIPLGSMSHAPDVGSYLLAEGVARWTTDLHVRLAAVAARRTIEQDPGVARVDHLDVRVQNGVVDVAFEATASSGAALGRVALAV